MPYAGIRPFLIGSFEIPFFRGWNDFVLCRKVPHQPPIYRSKSIITHCKSRCIFSMLSPAIKATNLTFLHNIPSTCAGLVVIHVAKSPNKLV